MRMRRSVIGILAGLILVAVPFGLAQSAVSPSSRLSQSDPIVEPPRVIEETTTIPVVGKILDPPPKKFAPPVTWEQAVAVAKTREDTSKAGRITPILALYTNPRAFPVSNEQVVPYTVLGPPTVLKVPAWLITIDGVCIPIFGGFRRDGASTTDPVCAGTQATVVVNALTGQFIEEFSYQ